MLILDQSHTILGTKSQRGLTQLALDLLYQSVGDNLVHPTNLTSVFPSLVGSDVSETQMFPASVFLDSIYGDGSSARGSCSRAQTPMPVNSPFHNPLLPQAEQHRDCIQHFLSISVLFCHPKGCTKWWSKGICTSSISAPHKKSS